MNSLKKTWSSLKKELGKNKKKLELSGILLLFLWLILGGIISIYLMIYDNRIYPKIKMGSTELSGLKIEEAEKKLNWAKPINFSTMQLRLENQLVPLKIEELMINYNARATAEKAFLLGRTGSFNQKIKKKLQLLINGEKIGMVFDYDENKLTELIKIVGEQIDDPAIEPSIFIAEDNTVQLVAGKDGRMVDREKLKADVLERISLMSFFELNIPIKTKQSSVNSQSMEQTRLRAEKIKNKELKLNYKDMSFLLKGEELLEMIDFNGGFEEEKIASYTASLAEKINRQPEDARFRMVNNRVVEFKPAQSGWKLDSKTTAEEILNKLLWLEHNSEEKSEEETEIKLAVLETEPEVKTSQVNDLGVNQLIGVGESTFHGSIASREHNVALTAEKLNGILLAPNEVFSFNQSLGDVSAATGYQQAYIIKDGRTILGDGGGVCQVSTTFFRAALDAGLPILERRAHAYRVNYYEQGFPAGIDATVYDPSPDLKFKNDTPGHILIQTLANTATNYLKIEFYGTSDGREAYLSNFRIWDQVPPPEPIYQDDPGLPAGVVKQVDWPAWGAKTAFDWKVVRGEEVIQQKTFYSNFRPWQAVYLKGVGN